MSWRECGETWETPEQWEARNRRVLRRREREARLLCLAVGLAIVLAGVVLAWAASNQMDRPSGIRPEGRELR
jgi:hypothetical protein